MNFSIVDKKDEESEVDLKYNMEHEVRDNCTRSHLPMHADPMTVGIEASSRGQSTKWM